MLPASNHSQSHPLAEVVKLEYLLYLFFLLLCLASKYCEFESRLPHKVLSSNPYLIGQSMAWPLTCAMDDSPEIHEGLSASRYALHPLHTHTIPVFTTWTHWWETTKPCQTPNKKRSLRVFFSPPFSYSASLCEQLLAGGSGETPAYSF